MRKRKLRIGLDVDDTLYSCNGYALELLSQRYPDEEPMSVNEIVGWGNYGRHADERIKMYSDPEFVKNQPIFPGAQKLVRDLSKYADVFFVTAVPVQCMTARAERLAKDFPEIPQQNIIIGTRKDVMALDIMLDDGAHNIANSKATYPVLFRQPWNMDMTGLLSVNSYADFSQFVKMVRNSFTEKAPDLTEGGVICLVGPTGCNKNEIAKEMTKYPDFEKPLTSTTRPKGIGEDDGSYRFITEEQFIKEKEAKHFIETTVYSKYHFGTSQEEVAPVVSRGGYAVIPIDICGALSMRNQFRGRTLLVFVNREKSHVIKNIIGRDIPEDDKVRRIMSLDLEYRNKEVCDIEMMVGDDPVKDAAVLVDMVRNGNLSL